jgi:hypothetical protein
LREAEQAGELELAAGAEKAAVTGGPDAVEQIQTIEQHAGVGSIREFVVHEPNEVAVAIARIEPNRIHHIKANKHAWDRICKNASDWDEIKNFITKTMLEGTNSTYKGELSKIFQINQEEVEVVYKVLGTGRLIISNAWVKT